MIKNTNDVMNNLYVLAYEIEKIMKSRDIKYKLGNYSNHYIKINNKYILQKFFIPVFTIKNIGDIGINIDGFFFEIMIPKKKITLEKLNKVIKIYPDVEIYGYKDCLHTFYKKSNSADNVFNKIAKSDEEIIQFSLNFLHKTSPDKLLCEFFKITKEL